MKRKRRQACSRALTLYEPVRFIARPTAPVDHDGLFAMAVQLRNAGATIQGILGNAFIIFAEANKVVGERIFQGRLGGKVTIEMERN